MAKKIIRRRKPGDLTKLKRALWQAVKRAEDILLDPEEETSAHLSAINALSQAAGNYYRIMEATDLADRITALEEKGMPRPAAPYSVEQAGEDGSDE